MTLIWRRKVALSPAPAPRLGSSCDAGSCRQSSTASAVISTNSASAGAAARLAIAIAAFGRFIGRLAPAPAVMGRRRCWRGGWAAVVIDRCARNSRRCFERCAAGVRRGLFQARPFIGRARRPGVFSDRPGPSTGAIAAPASGRASSPCAIEVERVSLACCQMLSDPPSSLGAIAAPASDVPSSNDASVALLSAAAMASPSSSSWSSNCARGRCSTTSSSSSSSRAASRSSRSRSATGMR